MTITEFNNQSWGAFTTVIYKGRERRVISVDFAEGLVGIDEEISGADEDEISWKRCENVEICQE